MQKLPIGQTAGPKSPTCSVLVVSCDRHRDLWRPFFTLFKRYWADCIMPVYLGAGSCSVDLDWVQTLNSDDAAPWSERLGTFLNAIPADYVLLLLEDFFIDEPVSTSAVTGQLELLHSRRGMTMRLNPNPPADYFRDGIGIIHSGAAYRVSTQAGIWNRRGLLNLLAGSESIWQFEWGATRRSLSMAAGFFCVRRPVIHYQHVVERGEWFHFAARRYAGQDIGCDLRGRPVMSLFKACQKAPANWARRVFNRARSYWLCLAHPESIPDGG